VEAAQARVEAYDAPSTRPNTKSLKLDKTSKYLQEGNDMRL
jgi:hypothetical protein